MANVPLSRDIVARDRIKASIMKQRMDLSERAVERLVDDAVTLLGNLVHYRHGGAHEESDLVRTAITIGQDIQED